MSKPPSRSNQAPCEHTRREDAAINFNEISALNTLLSHDDTEGAANLLDPSNTLFGSKRLHASARIIKVP